MSLAAGHRLTISGVSHAYQGVPALSNVSLEVAPGSLVALLGPSGCGKTTLLRIIAGFIRQTRGSILVDGEPIDELPAARRNVGIVFQNYALFPHLSVARNVGYGLTARGEARDKVAARVTEMLRLVQMERFAERLPGELSGGQQQRVALARALAVGPRIVLLDEPFSALDKGLRLDMQIEVKSLLAAAGVTSIIVTHDQEEALSMASRVVILNQGSIEQEGTPADVYDRPCSLFVNRFIGNTNLLKGRLGTRGPAGIEVDIAGAGRLVLGQDKELPAGGDVLVSVRPENLRLVADGPIAARVRLVMPLGPVDVIEAELTDGTHVKITEPHVFGARLAVPGDAVRLAITRPEACVLFSSGADAPDGASRS